jgi:hypothetical protein
MAKRLRVVYLHTEKTQINRNLDEYPWVNPHLILLKDINGYKIEIYSQTDYCFQGHRHSYVVKKSGQGYYSSGGYGENNEIVFPTIESAFLDSLQYVYKSEELKGAKRDYLLGEIL